MRIKSLPNYSLKSLFWLVLFLIFQFSGKTCFAQEKLILSAIPDQNPERLNRLHTALAEELSEKLNVKVIYRPIISYAAAVSAFRTDNIDLVWFGGLTGVQARIQKPGAQVIAQRDIDAKFRSVFIANHKSKIPDIKGISELKVLKGKRFTFGSENSTSGRLMPQYYLKQAGVAIEDFKGRKPGFSGSHDATLALVQSGSYEAGALNAQIWEKNLENGKVDIKKVKVIWRTPTYADYHWLAQPNLDLRFGEGFTKTLEKQLLSFNKETKRQRLILELFGADKFIPAEASQYKEIEMIGRELGKIND
ncbi:MULTISPECIES: putative selenate ABC transporter substrate-binding protein [Prochlorococcus]|uniref:putative selenate ABC transporter substrate-binding protein n=1 Tax=Prochlorococcus TaxID=1218 RepID=UPI000533BC08|nr:MULTISPECIES: putative selenate ABC transporter substrate-binding protein [Prochlorococcus]KGG12557.1 Phosphonate ABC transporter phosphate-binding periplasmic component [Prochlorococcus sp. MIT 0601]